MLKTCGSCKKTYPATEEYFRKVNKWRDTLRSYCYDCEREKAKNRKRRNYKKNREKYLERNKEYREKNKTYFNNYMIRLNEKIRSKLGVGYIGLHKYIRSHKIKPEKCEICGEIRKLELHCIKHNYTRDLSKWIYICKRCHCIQNRDLQVLK